MVVHTHIQSLVCGTYKLAIAPSPHSAAEVHKFVDGLPSAFLLVKRDADFCLSVRYNWDLLA